MTIPSHSLVMAAADTVQGYELQAGYQAAKAASNAINQLLTGAALAEWNSKAQQLTQNELKHCLRLAVMDAVIAAAQN